MFCRNIRNSLFSLIVEWLNKKRSTSLISKFTFNNSKIKKKAAKKPVRSSDIYTNIEILFYFFFNNFC